MMAISCSLAELFFPNRCLLCGGRAYGVLCHGCAPRFPLPRQRCECCFEPVASPSCLCDLCVAYPSQARHLRYLWEYEGIYRELLHTIKYKPSKRLATALGKTIAPKVGPLFPAPDWDLVVPIPSSRAALLHRGFNQAAVFAAECSLSLKIPWSVFALTHHGYRARQAEVSHERRYSNIKRTLRATRRMVSQKRILLIDDVLTTGATVGVACRELLAAEALSVDIFTVARSPSWHSTRAEMYAKLYSSSHEKAG